MTCTLMAVPYLATSAVTARNVLLNPALGALTGGLPDNWVAGAGTGGVQSNAVETVSGATPGPAGVPCTRAFVVTQTTTGTTAALAGLIGQAGTITAGQPYAGSVWVRSNEARQMRASIEWQTAAGATVSYVDGALVTLTEGAFRWYRLAVTGVAPATATKARLLVTTTTPMTAGHRFRLTAPVLGDGSAADYFEPGRPVPVGSWAAWSGTAHASMSTVTTKTPLPNLVTTSTPTLVLDYAAPRESSSVAHQVIGRTDLLHALGPLRPRQGTLSLFFETLPEAVACERLHEAPRVLLRDSERPELDMYYVPRTVKVGPSERSATQWWVVDVDYTEVYATAAIW